MIKQRINGVFSYRSQVSGVLPWDGSPSRSSIRLACPRRNLWGTEHSIAPGLLPEGSPERQWARTQIEATRNGIKAAHARGMKCFPSTDLFVLPKALAEKAEAVVLWRRIEKLAQEIHFADAATQEFVTTSAAYGRIKYAIVEQAWTIFFVGKAGDPSGPYDSKRLRTVIERYDALWAQWQQLASEHPSCATIYKDVGFEGEPGIGAAVDRYRRVLNGSNLSFKE